MTPQAERYCCCALALSSKFKPNIGGIAGVGEINNVPILQAKSPTAMEGFLI